MKLEHRMHMLYNESKATKPPYGFMMTPNERLLAQAADLENEALRREIAALEHRLLGKLAEKQDSTTRHAE
jgi:cell division septum initiation protein DivIVA